MIMGERVSLLLVASTIPLRSDPFWMFMPSHLLAQVPGWDDVVTTQTSDVSNAPSIYAVEVGSMDPEKKKELPFQDLFEVWQFMLSLVSVYNFCLNKLQLKKIQLDISTNPMEVHQTRLVTKK